MTNKMMLGISLAAILMACSVGASQYPYKYSSYTLDDIYYFHDDVLILKIISARLLDKDLGVNKCGVLYEALISQVYKGGVLEKKINFIMADYLFVGNEYLAFFSRSDNTLNSSLHFKIDDEESNCPKIKSDRYVNVPSIFLIADQEYIFEGKEKYLISYDMRLKFPNNSYVSENFLIDVQGDKYYKLKFELVDHKIKSIK